MRLGFVLIVFLMSISIASAAAFQFNSDMPRILWQDYKIWIIGIVSIIFLLFVLYFIFTSHAVQSYFEERNNKILRERLRKKLEELRSRQSVGISLSAE